MNLPIGKSDVLRVALKEVGADIGHFVADDPASTGDRTTRHHHAAGREGAHAERRYRAIAVTHGDFAWMNSQLLMRDLAKGRLKTLAMRLNTHQKQKRAVRHQSGGRRFKPGDNRAAARHPFPATMGRLLGVTRKT